MRSYLILFLLLCCVSIAFADAKKDAASKNKPSSPALRSTAPVQPNRADLGNALSDKPQPLPEMKKLAKMMAGRWNVEERFEVGPLAPQGGEAKGTESIHRGPGGLSLVSSYKFMGNMGDYKGNGIIAWSPEDNVFKSFWVDNGMPGGSYAVGKWEGEDLVFTSTESIMGQPMALKMTYSGFTAEGFTLYLDIGEVGAQLKRSKTVKFTRQSRQIASMPRRGMGMVGRPTVVNPYLIPAETRQ